MTIQTKMPPNLEMTISAEAMRKTQFLLKSLGFDLFEMWQHDSGSSLMRFGKAKKTLFG